MEARDYEKEIERLELELSAKDARIKELEELVGKARDAEKFWEKYTNRMDYTAKIHAFRYKSEFIKAIQSLHP